MPTQSGHTRAILASKVQGTAVYNSNGDKLGEVEDVILDKTSDHIMFAALGFGGVLGLGENYYPVPWSYLSYDEDKGGYVVPMSEEQLKKAPNYKLDDLTKQDGTCADIRTQSYAFYGVTPDW